MSVSLNWWTNSMGFPQSEASNQSNTESMVNNRVYANSCHTDPHRPNAAHTGDGANAAQESQQSPGKDPTLHSILHKTTLFS